MDDFVSTPVHKFNDAPVDPHLDLSRFRDGLQRMLEEAARDRNLDSFESREYFQGQVDVLTFVLVLLTGKEAEGMCETCGTTNGEHRQEDCFKRTASSKGSHYDRLRICEL